MRMTGFSLSRSWKSSLPGPRSGSEELLAVNLDVGVRRAIAKMVNTKVLKSKQRASENNNANHAATILHDHSSQVARRHYGIDGHRAIESVSWPRPECCQNTLASSLAPPSPSPQHTFKSFRRVQTYKRVCWSWLDSRREIRKCVSVCTGGGERMDSLGTYAHIFKLWWNTRQLGLTTDGYRCLDAENASSGYNDEGLCWISSLWNTLWTKLRVSMTLTHLLKSFFFSICLSMAGPKFGVERRRKDKTRVCTVTHQTTRSIRWRIPNGNEWARKFGANANRGRRNDKNANVRFGSVRYFLNRPMREKKQKATEVRGI